MKHFPEQLGTDTLISFAPEQLGTDTLISFAPEQLGNDTLISFSPEQLGTDTLTSIASMSNGNPKADKHSQLLLLRSKNRRLLNKIRTVTKTFFLKPLINRNISPF